MKSTPRHTSFTLWQDPPSIFRSAPFWSWNSKLDTGRLKEAIQDMHDAGMGGFFMHSRYGLKTPYLSDEWFKCIDSCVATAKRLGMKAYLYDEDRWPSGAAGGLVTRDNPEFRLKRVVACLGDETAGWRISDRREMMRFAIRLDEKSNLVDYKKLKASQDAPAGMQLCRILLEVQNTGGWYNDGSYLDTMNAKAVEQFIKVTHKAYQKRLGKHFGDLIPAIFTDEPNYGDSMQLVQDGRIVKAYHQWTADLPAEFRSRRGYDLLARLPEIFFSGSDDEFSKTRYDFRRTVTELFTERFMGQIGKWCGRNKIALTGHMLAEETLLSQIALVGAAMPHYEHEQWPGIDILTDSSKELNTAKQCSSVAAQLGKERVLSELYGCTGWDWPLEGHKYGGDWQFAAGVNFRCPHLTHYSLAGGAKRDYPASISAHSPWWKYYSLVEDYFARLGYMLTQGTPIRDVLVIHPIESAWGVYAGHRKGDSSALEELDLPLERITRTLCGQHYDWDFGDESLMVKYGKAVGGRMKVGKMSYKLVIVPPAITLRSSTLELLRKFKDSGGKVLFIGRQPTHLDAKPAKALSAFVSKCDACGDNADQFVPKVQELLPRRVSIQGNGQETDSLWTMLRDIKNPAPAKSSSTAKDRAGHAQMLFIQSHDRAGSHDVTVRLAGQGPIVLWNLLGGEKQQVESIQDGSLVQFNLHIGPTGSALVTAGMAVAGAAKPTTEPVVIKRKTIEGPYQVELTEPNTLNLDYCSYRIGEESFSKPVPSLAADAAIRASFGLGTRLGDEHQPWYLYATGVVDVAPRGRCQTRRTFHVTDLPRECMLAIEQPENFEIAVNGKPISKVTGQWVDRDTKTIDITSCLKRGENEVLLSFDYRPDMELEDLYLVGDFAVAAGPTRPAKTGKDNKVRSSEGISLIKPVRKLDNGSWVGQGLDFYGGAVDYRVKVKKPANGNRLRISLPKVACTAAAIHVNGQTFPLVWAPFHADITDALKDGANEIIVEVIGGRKNIMGPLHVPWDRWTGPGQFDPANEQWTSDYLLVDHGLMEPVVAETIKAR